MAIPDIDLWSNLTSEPIDVARAIASERQNVEKPFYVVDLDDVSFKLKLWRDALPRVEPHYAVKCNTNRVILKLLVEAGIGFDCATKNEIDLMLSLGAAASKIVYAHTIKCTSYIRWARERGVTRMTYDNIEELEKIKKDFPDALLILRLQVVDEDAYNMTDKFGCPPEEVDELLRATRDLQMNLHGFSFHVGCHNQDGAVYRRALNLCKDAESVAVALGYNPKFIDIGGGFDCFRGNESKFRKTAEIIRAESDSLFPATEGYTIISEPGTFFVGSSLNLCARVVGRRNNKGMVQLYVNDSIYVSFLLALYGDGYLQIQPLKGSEIYTSNSDGENLNPTRIFGITCDGVDIIIRSWQLPEIEIGDWILFYNQGAYTEALETDFNMLERPDRYYRSSSPKDIEVARCIMLAENSGSETATPS